MLEILADVHERRSGIPARLADRGARVDIRRLDCGDYTLGVGCFVERKTAIDLHLTIEQGRFWAQLRRLRAGAARPILLVEGVTPYTVGGLPPRSIRGILLAVSDIGVSVVRSTDASDSAAWLVDIANRTRGGAARDRPRYAQRPSRPGIEHPAEEALAAAPGVSVATARALLRRFGSLRAVASTRREDLLEVPGVGPARAAAILSMINDEWTAGTTL